MMWMKTKGPFVWFAIALAVGVCGCVRGGDYDLNDVYRLQQAILARNPQNRPEEGLGLMLPISRDIPLLEISKDPETGQRCIRLALREAVMRALANNVDIAVVSYDPQIAHEQVVQAAAAFDYVLFGSMGYTSTDLAINYRSLLPQEKERTLQIGVRQRTVTGASWQISDTFIRSWNDATTDRIGRWYQSNLELQVTQPLLRDAWPEVNLASLRIARLNHKITMSQFRQQVEETVTQVIATYYQLIQARREVEIAQELLVKTKKTYKQVIGRRHIDATKVNRTQALAAVKRREVFEVQAKKVLQDTQDALARLLSDNQINLLQEYKIIPTTPMSHHPVKIDQTDQLLTALRLNPQLEQARLGIQQADINVRVAKNQTLPSLNITAGTTLNGASRASRGVMWDDVWSGRFISYNAALEFEYPIGNRERRALLAESRLGRKKAISQMQNVADAVDQAIRERIRQVYARHTEYLLQTEAMKAAKDQLEALEILEKIRAQLTPEFLDFKLNTQEEVALAERSQLDALVKYNTAILDLNRTTGSVLEMSNVKLALPVVSQPAGVEMFLPKPTTKPTSTPAGPEKK